MECRHLTIPTQENGYKTENRWVNFTNDKGEGIKITAPKYFGFSVVPDCKLPNDNLVHYGHRTLGNGDIYFITNQTDKKQKLQVILHFKTIVNRIKIDFQRLLSILIELNQFPSLLFFTYYDSMSSIFFCAK